jgi:RNA-binding protein
MNVNDKQRKYLSGLAHDIKPTVFVGNSGVTDGVLGELSRCLDHHELIKVKLRLGDREARKAAVQVLVEASGADLVNTIGNMAILYRPNRKDPRIALP